jgi:hypothetical protein
LDRKKPERKPLTPRARRIMWLAIGIAPAFVYPLLAYVMWSAGYEPQTTRGVDSWVGVFIAFGIVLLFFNLMLIRRTNPVENDTAFIICLALAEAISIDGLLLFLVVGWTWGFWAMLLMSLMSAWSLRPAAFQQDR